MMDQASVGAGVSVGTFPGRFTASDGVRGWAHACFVQRQPYYGAGTVVVGAESVTVRGWQRTWLGMAEAVEVAFARPQIRNCARYETSVRFEVRIGRRWRSVEFSLPDEALAESLLSALPGTRTAGFDDAWAGLQEFNRLVASQRGRHWVTPTLVLVNLGAFIAMIVQSGGQFVDPQEIARWANAGFSTTRGEWWRLVTATFLHWNIAHLALNLWALWNAGRITERLYGSLPYLGLYLASGLVGGLATLVWNPAVVSAGASGAVFGVLGALIASMLGDRGLPGVVVKAHRWSTLAFVTGNLAIGAVSPSTDNAAHVGGLVAGLLLGWLLSRPVQVDRRTALSLRQVAAASGVVGAVLVLGAHAVSAPAARPDGAYVWIDRHDWYVDGEIAHFRDGTRLDWQLNSGQISPADYAQAIRKQLLPFLQQAARRLEAEPFFETGYGGIASQFVTARRDWLETLADAIEASDREESANAGRLKDKHDSLRSRLEIMRVREQFDGTFYGLRAWLLDAYWSRKLAASGKCVLPPDAWRWVAHETDSPDDGPGRRRAAGCRAQRSLILRGYAGLEQQLTAAVANLDDLPDGSATYSGIISGLDNLLQFGEMPPELLLRRFADWRRAHPDSVFPDLLEAELYHDWAWAARGHGYAKEVRAQDWELFRYRVGLARAALDTVADRRQEQPHWYTMAINLAADGNDAVESIRSTFDEGVARFPRYQPLYRSMLRVLMPRWRGSSDEVADFIEQASFTRPESTYARLYATYADLEGDDVDIFRNKRVNWLRLLAGLEQLRIDHPSSDLVLNTYAYMTCRKGDAAAYARVRDATGDRPSWTAWSDKYTLASCDERFAEQAANVDARPVAPVGGSVDSEGNVLTAADREWVRRQTGMALEAAEPVRIAISRYIEEHGGLPPDEVLRQLPEFRAVNPMGATVEVGAGASIKMKLSGGPLDGHGFSWAPLTYGDEIRWQCAQETVPEEFLGPPCRDTHPPGPQGG